MSSREQTPRRSSLRKNMRRLFILLFFALSAALPAQQKPATMLQLPPKPLLPMSFAGWTAISTPVESTSPPQDFAVEQNFLNELGLRRVSLASYQKEQFTMKVTAFQFQDASSAYAYLPNYSTNGQFEEVHGSTNTPPSGGLRNGDTVLSFEFSDVLPPHLSDDIQVLAKTLPIPFGSKGQTPDLPQYLPKSSLVASSVRYAFGPSSYAFPGYLPASLIDFSRDAETLIAQYNFHGQPGALLLIEYPTPQMAIERTQAIQNWLTSNKPREWWKATGCNESMGAATIPYPTTVDIQLCAEGPPVLSAAAIRSGPIVAIAAGEFSQKDADALASEVHYESEVTWNHTEGYVSDAWRAAHLYLGIFALAGILCAASVILGLFFGGARALTRVMRGKSASAVEDTEFISLDLGHGGDYKPGPKN